MEKISSIEFDPWNVTFLKKIQEVSPVYKNKQTRYICYKQEDFEIASFTIDTNAWIYSCRVDNLFDFTAGFLKSLEKTSLCLSVKNKNNITKHNRFIVEGSRNSNIEWKNYSTVLSYFLKLKKDVVFIYQQNYYNYSFFKKISSSENSMYRLKMGNLLYNFCLINDFFLYKILAFQKKTQSENYYIITSSQTFIQIEAFCVDVLTKYNNLELFPFYNQKFCDESSIWNSENNTNRNASCDLNYTYNRSRILLDFENSYNKEKKKINKQFSIGKKNSDLNYIGIGFFESTLTKKEHEPFFFLKSFRKINLNYDMSIWVAVKNILRNNIKKKKIDILGYDSVFEIGKNLKFFQLKSKKKNFIGKKKFNLRSIFNLDTRKNFFYFKKLLIFSNRNFENYINLMNMLLKNFFLMKKCFIKCKYLFFDLSIFFKMKGFQLKIDCNFKKNFFLFTLNYLLKMETKSMFLIYHTNFKYVTLFIH
jgi:hypothetical protein